MKLYWFKLIEHDEPMPIKHKTYKALILLGGILIGVMGSYFLIPPKVVDAPVESISLVEPTANPQPITKNPMQNHNEEKEDDD